MSNPKYQTLSSHIISSGCYKPKDERFYRPPLKSFAELAEEFGLTQVAFARHLKRHDAPKPNLRVGSSHTRKSYYNPKEVREWWAKLLEEKNGGAGK